MELSLFSTDGLLFLFRWGHFLAGITWIGVLYYFNFIQGAFFAETEAQVKTAAVQKLVPRALWWFRWGAMLTILSGLAFLGLRGHQGGWELFSTSWGVSILSGAALGTLMWFNVWFVIWPAQKVVIAAAKGEAVENAAVRGARAAVVSRTNTLLSIPMLFFMAAASHLPLQIGFDANFGNFALVLAVILALIEWNALKGKTGPMTTVKGVISCGFGLTAVLYLVMEILL